MGQGVADIMYEASNEREMMSELVKAVRHNQRSPEMVAIFPVPTDNGEAFRRLLGRLDRADLAYCPGSLIPGQDF